MSAIDKRCIESFFKFAKYNKIQHFRQKLFTFTTSMQTTQNRMFIVKP